MNSFVKRFILKNKNQFFYKKFQNLHNSSLSNIFRSSKINFRLKQEDDLLINKRSNKILERYDELVKSNHINYDSKQFEVVLNLNNFYNQIVDYEPKKLSKNKIKFFFQSIFHTKNEKNEKEKKSFLPEVKSIYLHGGVGKKI